MGNTRVGVVRAGSGTGSDSTGSRPGRRGVPGGESGQATVEYILLLSFVVSLGVGLTRAMLTGLDEGILVFGATLEKDLQTGRMNPGAWTEE